MKRMMPLSGLVFLIGLVGCNSGSHDTGVYDTMARNEILPAREESIDPVRKIITRATIEFATNDISATRQNIVAAIEKYDAYTSSDDETKSPGRVSNTMVIRVPSPNFDQMLSEITSGVDRFDEKRIEVQDVTEEFLDVEARLKTKKELESRYLQLLKEAKNVTEVLEIEKQIGELRSEIESIEGRLKYLENNVTYSTITVTFYQKVPLETEFGQKFRIGFRNGWDNLVWFFVFLTNIWPFIVIILVLVFSVRYWKKKQRKK
jgi:hypothetical protein